MTRASFRHNIGDLADDLRTIAVTAKPKMAVVVARDVGEGLRLAQGFARSASGIHGTNYYKRITSEMTGLLVGEFGPTGDVRGNAVGAGWRHGVNTDLPKAADIIGPKLARDVGDVLDGLFWPGA
jgi:hypothetical protein